MDLLARREYARIELQRKLVRKGFESADVEAIASELEAEGLQSDERCAEAVVRSSWMKGYGPLRVRADLNQRGIAAALAERMLEQTEVDWEGLDCEVRSKRFGATVPVTLRERSRQVRFLRYRGFTGEQVNVALRESIQGATDY